MNTLRDSVSDICNRCLGEGYDQKGRVEVQRLNFKCEQICIGSLWNVMQLKKTKQDKTKPIQNICIYY